MQILDLHNCCGLLLICHLEGWGGQSGPFLAWTPSVPLLRGVPLEMVL